MKRLTAILLCCLLAVTATAKSAQESKKANQESKKAEESKPGSKGFISIDSAIVILQ